MTLIDASARFLAKSRISGDGEKGEEKPQGGPLAGKPITALPSARRLQGQSCYVESLLQRASEQDASEGSEEDATREGQGNRPERRSLSGRVTNQFEGPERRHPNLRGPETEDDDGPDVA